MFFCLVFFGFYFIALEDQEVKDSAPYSGPHKRWYKWAFVISSSIVVCFLWLLLIHLPAEITQQLQEFTALCQYVYVLSQQPSATFSKYINASISMDTIAPSVVMPTLVCVLKALAGGILAARLLSGISKPLVWALTSSGCCSLIAFGTADS